jgi:alcohol dehydrogenase class IV
MTNIKPIANYFGTDLLEHPALPIIAIPTTAGTGSEVTPIAILSDEDEQLKKGIVSTAIIPRYAFLDPAFTASMPPKITSMTGIDALCHAIEAYTSLNAMDYSDSLALRAIRLISGNIREAFEHGDNLAARGNMLMGSLLAGMAFANAGVTAVHAFAYPLGGMFHVPHGLANSLMLPAIMNYNIVGNETRFAEIAEAMFARGGSGASAQASDALAAVRELFRVLQMPQGLAAVGVPQSAIPELAQGAMKVTRLLANNPRPITRETAEKLYAEAF